MRTLSTSSLLISGLILFLSITALFINDSFYQYQGNNFFPEDMPLLTTIVLIANLGLIVFFGKNSRISKSGIEFIYFFCVMSIIAFASNAIQLTPFQTIDAKILSLETYFKINYPAILAWTNDHPFIKNVLGFIYDTLPFQMSIIPLIIIILGKFSVLREYFFFLLFSALIGFGFYYFFPTTAPASIITSPFFSPYQLATGIKFYEIHHHIIPSTIEGGLIALPSFHTLWAIFCVYLLKNWTIPCILLALINSLLILSCVLLGWHYILDVLFAIILAMFSYGALKLILYLHVKSF